MKTLEMVENAARAETADRFVRIHEVLIYQSCIVVKFLWSHLPIPTEEDEKTYYGDFVVPGDTTSLLGREITKIYDLVGKEYN